MRTILLILASVLFAITMCNAQVKTSRGKLKPISSVTAKPEPVVIAADTTAFRIFGYEKTLKSGTESFFAENLTADTITSVQGVIEYRTMDGRQLHRRNFTHPTDLPPGQIRQITIPAWDRQKVWYYHLSAPTRTYSQATPYTVAISITGYTE